ncbi:hypothetical protein [Methanohalobium sp.]|uniref:hypothetical protein n=1 Tax=Methanohalobium sp. TaxID=2837493 RepID=UPI0025F403DE|nr:hypothetical protein [Methanohalobium sp.]
MDGLLIVIDPSAACTVPARIRIATESNMKTLMMASGFMVTPYTLDSVLCTIENLKNSLYIRFTAIFRS